MPLTESQRQAVECTGRPLFIQAGAGTGKTFTLTKRLAHGLAEGTISDVANLLTITFTNKAAGELLGRVRAELRSRGLMDAALKVDAAWISTIHSMCQRMLSEHAFEAGIDPGAQMLDEVRSGELLGQAIDATLKKQAGTEGLELLLATLGGAEKVSDFIRKAVGLLCSMPHGASDFDLGPKPPADFSQLLAQAAQACAQTRAELEGIDFASENKTSAKYFTQVVDYESILNDAVAELGTAPVSIGDARAVFEQVAPFKHGTIKKEPARSILDDLCDCLGRQQAQVAAALSYAQCRALLELAEQVQMRHRALKRALGSIDLNDVLIEAYRLLEKHPDIAAEYQGQFESIMIDEFQDTDALQVAIAKHLADEGLTTLATVGDAQQSIYGFRGADLEVYRAMRQEMAEHDALNVALDMNFRSHSGILQFVEAVFSTPDYFGGEFLKVKPGPANDRDQVWAAVDEPRVRLALMAGEKDEESGKGALAEDLRSAEANYIAQEFERLHERGASYGGMAVLLRTMSNARLYQDALKARGIPCIVSGGSSFYKSVEVGLVVELLRFLENPDDDEALFDLLGSEVFDVSDDDLLALAAIRRDEAKLPFDSLRKKASLFDALCLQAQRVPQDDGDLLVRAHAVLSRALAEVGSRPLSSTVLAVERDSGWQDALRAAGTGGAARQANIQRMCDLIDDYEKRYGSSVLRAAEYFRNVCNLAKDGAMTAGKPATMVSPGGSAVQIMTFHASKGLEFPIVALAEYDSKLRSSVSLQSLTEHGAAYLSLSVTKSSLGGEYLLAHADDEITFAQASTPASFLSHALGLSRSREAEEAQRLLYVALTRARDLLIVMGHDGTYASTATLASGQFSSMVEAAFPEGVSWSSVARTRTGALVSLEMQVVQRGSAQAEAEEPSDAWHYVCPVQTQPRVSARVVHEAALHSYSSIAHREAVSTAPAHAAAIQLRDRSEDAESVAPVGSAFHLVAQWLSETRGALLEALSGRIAAAARRFELDAEQAQRLDGLVDAWMASELYEQIAACPQQHAEYAFVTDVRGVALEGFIDLLCLDTQARRAHIVDYKTGVSGEGEDLHDRYRLQACCYSYAVLSSGVADTVDVTFVRVEAGMEQVEFSFGAVQLDELADFILAQ